MKCTDIEENHTYDAAEFGNRNDQNDHGHTQYNTLQREGATSTLSRVNLNSGQYKTIGEREMNTKSDGLSSTRALTHVHEAYDEVEIFRDRQDGKECHSKQESKKACKVTPQEYEIVCVIPTEDQRSKEISNNHQFFDDDMYSTNQSVSTKMGQRMQMASEGLYSEIADNNSSSSLINGISKNEPEYAEPQVAKRAQSNNKGQGTLLVEENFYHSLEGSDKQLDSTSVSGTPKGQQTKHTENTVHIYDSPDSVVSPSNISMGKNKCSTIATQMDTGGNRYHTLTPPTTTVPQCNQSLNEECPANFPAILLNTEHCPFDDPLYEDAPQHSNTLQECNDVKVDIYNFDDPTYS